MSVSMSGGWTHTAKVHSTLGFDITFSGSFTKVPSSDYTFNASSLDLGSFTANGIAPTMSASSDVSGPRIERTLPPVAGTDPLTFGFDGMDGLGINFGGMIGDDAYFNEFKLKIIAKIPIEDN